MIELLNKLGYHIKDVEHKQCLGWNLFDVFCLAVYTCISLSNLLASSPSIFIWVLNLTILGRIIVRNKIEAKELESLIVGMESNAFSRFSNFYFFVNWHTKKLVAETTSGVFSLLILVIGSICRFRYGVTDNSFNLWFFVLGVSIISLSFFEDLLKIIVKIYSAELPLQDGE